MAELYFITGISGVGKTWLIKQFVDQNDKFCRVSASKLIENAKAKNIDSLGNNNGPLAMQVDSNQALLLDELEKFISVKADKKILFDGHSVIDTVEGLVQIDVNVIDEIGPKKIIFLEDLPENILKRRQNDENRNRPRRTLEYLTSYQEASLEQCNIYAQILEIELCVIPAGDHKQLERVLSN